MYLNKGQRRIHNLVSLLHAVEACIALLAAAWGVAGMIGAFIMTPWWDLSRLTDVQAI